MYRAYCEAYEDGGIQDREHWREVLTDPVTVRGYERLQTLLDAYGEEDGTVNSADSEEPAANLHTLLLPGGDVGYVKIDSFPAEYEDSYATDRAALTDFYRQAADCTDLIIDLTDNSGGSEVYWQQLLAAPLTDRPLSCTNYALLAESDNYAYVRTSEGGAGAYDCGDFGYLPIADLSLAQTGQSIGVAQADDGDLPVVVLGDPDDEKSVIGALCSGAQARITSYTQTDYVQISLGSLVGYVKKSQIRVLTAPNEPLSDRIPQRATTKTDVDIRFKPEVKAAVVETVSSGARVYMFGKFGDWAYVLAGDSPSLDVTATTGDRAGFVPLAALNAPASTTHLTASVLKDKVNVRSEADNQSGAIIGKARTGDRLLVTDYGNKWTGVVLPDGKRGYMMTEYLQFD